MHEVFVIKKENRTFAGLIRKYVKTGSQGTDPIRLQMSPTTING